MNRYDFWATVTKVYVSLYWFAFRKEPANAEATLKAALASVLQWLYRSQQTCRNGIAAVLKATASKIECPSVVVPVVTLPPVEVVEVAQTLFNELETAYPDEVPHERTLRQSKGKARADYKPVKEPSAGSVYWFKRGRRWVECYYMAQALAA
jgi:hypothetical protein